MAADAGEKFLGFIRGGSPSSRYLAGGVGNETRGGVALYAPRPGLEIIGGPGRRVDVGMAGFGPLDPYRFVKSAFKVTVQAGCLRSHIGGGIRRVRGSNIVVMGCARGACRCDGGMGVMTGNTGIRSNGEGVFSRVCTVALYADVTHGRKSQAGMLQGQTRIVAFGTRRTLGADSMARASIDSAFQLVTTYAEIRSSDTRLLHGNVDIGRAGLRSRCGQCQGGHVTAASIRSEGGRNVLWTGHAGRNGGEDRARCGRPLEFCLGTRLEVQDGTRSTANGQRRVDGSGHATWCAGFKHWRLGRYRIFEVHIDNLAGPTKRNSIGPRTSSGT